MVSWRAVVVTVSLLVLAVSVWQTARVIQGPVDWGPPVVDLFLNGVKVRKYIPSGGPSSEAAIIYIHGGGWQHGSVDLYDEVTRWLSDETGMTVISLDYRLAPRHVFPIAVDDCGAASRHYLLGRVQEHGVDPRRVAVVGDNAGGNLAAAVSLRLRDRNVVPPLKAQILINPATQALDFRLPSYLRSRKLEVYRNAKYWLDYAMGNDSHVHRLLDNAHISPDTRKRFAKYINNDTVVTMSSADTPYENLWQQLEPIVTNPYFSPGLADDLSRLPRTLILTAGQDPLHDDGKIYAKRLKDSGNDVTHRDYPSAQHGIYRNINTEINREMRQAIKEFLLRHL